MMTNSTEGNEISKVLVTYQVVRQGFEFRDFAVGQVLRAHVQPENLKRFVNRVTVEGAKVVSIEHYKSSL
jgi:hypothetical protein